MFRLADGPDSHASPSRAAAPSANLTAPTPIVRRKMFEPSLTGVVYVAILIFMGLAAVQNRANLLYGVFGLMIGTLLISGVITQLMLRGLIVRRVLPDHGVVGVVMRGWYELTNSKKFWPSFSVTLAELDSVDAFSRQPQCYMLHAAARVVARIPADFLPKRRGIHSFGSYQLSTGFPFGFVRRTITRTLSDRVMIYPAIGKVDQRVLALCRAADLTGTTVRPQPGGSDEFFGVKQFREGENPRMIYWRRSARTGELVVREMTRVAPPRLLLFVDTFQNSLDLKSTELVERTIAMAASLASAALEQGMAVGLAAWNGDWIALAPARGKQQRADLLSSLARLPTNTAQQPTDLLDQSRRLVSPGVTTVLLTPGMVQFGLADQVRGAILAISASSENDRSWFQFERDISFVSCAPSLPQSS